MKTVSIISKENDIKSSQNVPIHAIITLDTAFVDVSNYLNDGDLGILLQLQHHQPITTLHLTDVTPYVLLCFDEALHYKGAAYSLKSVSSLSTKRRFENLD
ncbi:hypothetical protein SAMN04515667_0971 [Formosa sp. Hel1_31_208]|uniref:hypothetical protein n=1 Tax=Formosa sp. Hel1_31_208 TaxID=1798225 RepID=UPI00087C798F|nr:hypothetical protein [Formosa sp. Hel1_31_208]SDR91127.1 hypothetical protein SAMN04515667_0971 [Formosa sp. Hel1_31_208]